MDNWKSLEEWEKTRMDKIKYVNDISGINFIYPRIEPRIIELPKLEFDWKYKEREPPFSKSYKWEDIQICASYTSGAELSMITIEGISLDYMEGNFISGSIWAFESSPDVKLLLTLMHKREPIDIIIMAKDGNEWNMGDKICRVTITENWHERSGSGTVVISKQCFKIRGIRYEMCIDGLENFRRV